MTRLIVFHTGCGVSSLGGEMLAPGDGNDHLQVIDALDVAQFIKIVIEYDMRGIFNLAGLRITWSDFMNALGAKNIVWVIDEIIKSEGLTEFDLPLYRKDGCARSSLMNVSNVKAAEAGLNLTDIQITIKDTLDSLKGRNIIPALSSDIERRLINITGLDKRVSNS